MKLTTDISRQDFFEFNKFVFIKNRLKRTVMIGAISIGVLFFVLNDMNDTAFSWIAFLIYYILMGGIYYLAIYLALLRTKKSPKADGTILGKKELEFTDDKIMYHTEDSEGSYKWTIIKELDESPKTIYLFFDTNMGIIIPKRIFKNEGEMAEFKELVSRKIRG